MNCPKCGAQVQPNAAFCAQCGQRIIAAEAAAPQVSAAADALLAPRADVAAVSSADDRALLWEGRYSIRGMIDRVILTGLLTLVALVALIWLQPSGMVWAVVLAAVAAVWVSQAVVYVLRRYGHLYRLTPHTFFHDSGILVRSSSPIEIIAIDDISYSQSIAERLFGVGTIRILSNDTSDPVLTLRGIADVQNAFATIDEARRAERRRRAVRVDAV